MKKFIYCTMIVLALLVAGGTLGCIPRVSTPAPAPTPAPFKTTTTLTPVSPAQENYNRARALLNAGKYDEAIAEYTKAIAIDPKYTNAYANRGLAYYYKGQYDTAITDLNKAIELDSKDVYAYNHRGLAYYNKGQYDTAITDFNKAIELDSGYPGAYANRGIAYNNKKQYDMAITDLNKAIELDPKYANAYANRASTYSNMKLRDLAIADYNMVLQLTTDIKLVQFAKEGLKGLEQSTVATQVSSQAIEHNNRGIDLANAGKYDEAIAEYTKAIAIDPKYARAYVNRGAAYNNKKQYDMAITDFNKAIELDPKYAFAYFARGNAYSGNGLYDLAIADYSKTIELDPKYAMAYVNRGAAYNNKKQYDMAISDLNKAIELDPKYANAYANRGWVYSNMKLRDLAIADYKRVMELSTDTSLIKYASDSLKSLEQSPVITQDQEAKLVLEDAINYTGAYPAPSAVSYTSSSGQSRTVNAYPGQVQVFFETSTSKTYAQGAIKARNGTVLGQIPFLGYYLVGVTTGSERDFISSILRDKSVNLALPNMHVKASQGILLDETWITGNKVVPLNVQPGIILLDYFVGQDHGQQVVKSVAENGGSTGTAIQIGIGSSGETTADKVTIAIAAAVAGNSIFNPGQPTLINLSSAGGTDEKDYTLLSPDKQKIHQAGWENFIGGVLTGVAALPPSLRDNIVLTNSAGNGNMPISELLADLRSYPMLKDVIKNNFLIVGTMLTGTSTKEFPTGRFSNYASGDPDIAIMNNKMAVGGTSFAAPAALAIIQQVMNQTGVSSRQALEAAKLAVKNNSNHELNLKEAIGQAELIREQGQSDLTKINQKKLDAAIQAGDIQGIIEAMKVTLSGAIPDEQAKQQWKRGQLEVGKINQKRLDAAIKAGDANGIGEALRLAMSGLLSEADAEAQERQGQKALAALLAKPDLTVTSVSFSPSSGKAGQSLSVTFTVKNQGVSASVPFSNRISLATTRFGTNYSLGNFAMESLPAGASRPVTVATNTIPSSVPEGSYWVTVFTDGLQRIDESEENNNIGSSGSFKVEGATAPVCTPGSALAQLTCVGKTGFQGAPNGSQCDCNDPRNRTSAFDSRFP